MVIKRRGLLVDSHIFNPENLKLEGYLLLGYNVNLRDFSIIPVYENILDGSIIPNNDNNPPLPTKYQILDLSQTKIVYEEDGKEHPKFPKAARHKLNCSKTNAVFFQKKAISEITKGYSKLYFSNCKIVLGPSLMSEPSNKKYDSLKCEGHTRINKSAPNLRVTEESSSITFGVPTPPEYDPSNPPPETSGTGG